MIKAAARQRILNAVAYGGPGRNPQQPHPGPMPKPRVPGGIAVRPKTPARRPIGPGLPTWWVPPR